MKHSYLVPFFLRPRAASEILKLMLLPLLALAAAMPAAAQSKPAPFVTILSPDDGAAMNQEVLEVEVLFRSDANPMGNSKGRTGNVHTVVLFLDGVAVDRYDNPPAVKEDSWVFTVDISQLAEGYHTLRALAYQGNPRAGLSGESETISFLIDRTPPEVEIFRPVDGFFVINPSVFIDGFAEDTLAGLVEVSCDGEATTLGSFSCEVPLLEGANDITVEVVDAAGNKNSITLTINYVPGGVPGAPLDAAVGAVFDRHDFSGIPQHEVSLDSAGAEVARTQLEIAFHKDVTVAEFNLTLQSVNAHIVSMLAGVTIVTVSIPDPGSYEGLQAVVSQLEAAPSVRFVNLGYFGSPMVLPSNITPVASDLVGVRHHLAVRGHAAWNAADILDGPQAKESVMLVADFYGDRSPLSYPEAPLSGIFGRDNPNQHGYHVMGIIGAPHRGDGNDYGFVSGMHPSAFRLQGVDYIVDASSRLTGAQFNNAVVQSIRNADRNVVLNTSLSGWSCDTPALAASFCTPEYASQRAVTWIEKVRGSSALFNVNIENKFLHLTAAGNIHPNTPDATEATLASEYAAAKLFVGLETPGVLGPEPVPNLGNILVVENVAVSQSPPPYSLACLNASSKYPGDIAAVGTEVLSFFGPAQPEGAGFLTGTSMASPQVAGLAAYLWDAAPFLTPQEVIELLESTARPDHPLTLNHSACNTTRLPAPVIDAYAAFLALDQAFAQNAGALTDTPVRLALLDVAGSGTSGQTNGQFDEFDIELFLHELERADLDYGRYDLNGDGETWGTVGTERFDLDINHPSSYSNVQQEVAGDLVTFDETALTDVEVLCYYAYSPLYVGDPAERDASLLPLCVDVELQVEFPSTVVAGEDTPLTVRAVRRHEDGSTSGMPGLTIDLTVLSGGTLGSTSGSTDQDGYFRTNARLSQNSQVIEILLELSSPRTDLFFTSTLVEANAAASIEIVEVSRRSSEVFARAQAGCVFITEDRDQDEENSTAPFSAGVAAGASAEEGDNSSSGNADASQQSSISFDASGGLSVSGNGSATALVSQAGSAVPPPCSSTAVASSSFRLDFEVRAASVAYEVSGSASHFGDVSGGSASGVASLFLLRLGESGSEVLLGDSVHNNSFSGSRSGVLQPGSYRLLAGGGGMPLTLRFEHTQGTVGASWNVSLRLTPAQ